MKKNKHNLFTIFIILNLLCCKIYGNDTIVYSKKFILHKTSISHVVWLGEVRSIIETNYFTKNYSVGLLYSYFLNYPFEYAGLSDVVNRWGFSVGPVFNIEDSTLRSIDNIFECAAIDISCYYSFIKYHGAEGGCFFNHGLSIEPGFFGAMSGDSESRQYFNSIFDFNKHAFTLLSTFSVVINIKKLFISPYIGIGIRYVCVDFIKFKFHSSLFHSGSILIPTNTSCIHRIFPLINFGIYLGFKKDIYE